eukprot:7370487-Ditylum_brightwellii.AAC.1
MAKQKHSTKALVLMCDRGKANKMKNMLYKMNVDSCKEKQRWSQPGTWFFVPFQADSPITSLHIAKMIKCQNISIQDAVHITISVITNIKAHVKKPDSFATTSFALWILSMKSSSGAKLFHLVEQDSNDIYYFCNTIELKDAACTWINKLEESLSNLFLPTEIDKITTGTKITRSYTATSSENAKDAAAAYKNYFKSQNDPIDVDAEHKY